MHIYTKFHGFVQLHGVFFSAGRLYPACPIPVSARTGQAVLRLGEVFFEETRNIEICLDRF
jgi:hypothetical protein